MDYKISDAEREGLYGLPYLQQLIYFRGIRPYMDFTTGIVGIKRGISYQSLCDELYIDAHPGYQSGSPSKAQVRRALKGLERAGVIRLQSQGKKLQVACILAVRDSCVSNKAVTKPSHQNIHFMENKNDEKSMDHAFFPSKADNPKREKAVTPPVTDHYFYFLRENFETFWNQYPVKKSKQKTWEIFQILNPSEELFQIILNQLKAQCDFYQAQQAKGCWVPHWKYPANWLAQRCWEDEINVLEKGEDNGIKANEDKFWRSCQSGVGIDREREVAEILWLEDYQNK